MSDESWEQLREAAVEGLRERKKRLTRQSISDVATRLFVERGFDAVRIAEIAERVGVSEKTVYNYFPTKESLVFDRADAQLERLSTAVRERHLGESPVGAFVAALKQDVRWADDFGDSEQLDFSAFSDLIRTTPALRAAWGEHRHRLVETLTEILADSLGVDPQEPEPLTAARGLVSLAELFADAQLRRANGGLRGHELQDAVEADLERAARLLETGFWSLHLLVEGRRSKAQLHEAAIASERARKQVLAALRDAKRAWREVREVARDARAKARELG